MSSFDLVSIVNEDINQEKNEQLETMFVTQSITTCFAHKDRVEFLI